jgi:DNA repair protein RadC
MKQKPIFCCGEPVNEISLRYNHPPNRVLPVIKTHWDAIEVMGQCFEDDRMALKEFFFAMYLSRTNEALAISRIGVGTENAVTVSVKEIVSNALLLNALHVIVAHNHPGGSTSFSHADKKISRQLLEALKLFDLRLLDHLLFTKSTAVSLAETDSLLFET